MKKLISALLAATMLMMAIPLQIHAATTPVEVISWEDYYAGATGNTGDMVVTRETDYLNCQVKTVASNATQRAVNFTIAQPEQFAAGDSVLIRIVARAADTEGQMYLTLGRTNYDVTKSTSTVTVPTAWTEFFFPIAAGGTASRLYVRLGQKVQTIQIKDLQVINYGDYALSQLPTGSRDATVTPTVNWDSYYSGATGNTGDMVVTKETDYLNCQVKTIDSNATQRAVNFTLQTGKVNPGDNTLVRVVMRSTDGNGVFYVSYRNTTEKKEKSSAEFTVPATWTEYFIPLASSSASPNRLIVRLGQKVQTIQIADMELINYGSADLASLPTGYRPVLENTATEPPAEPATKKDFTQALAGTVSTSASYTFAASDLTVASGDMLLFSTVVKGETASRHIRITATFEGGSTVMEYAVPVQATRINMPITADGKLVSFTVEALDGAVVISEATVENRGTATQEDLLVESGMHMLDTEYTDYMLSETGVGAGKTTDLVSSNGYIYSIGSGSLTVTDAAQKKVLGTVSGLGDTRQIALCASGTDVMVTARGYGAYIIDVSDPTAPKVRAEYDSVEMATGISIEGNYAYISCRQYGVDVVDLSDLDKPKHLCIIRTGEVQSCKVVDNILYAGLWGECRVDMYDVSDPANSTLLGSATLSGKGDGTAIYKADGKVYLFAATGHHTPSLSVTTPLSDLRYGQGNGLDVFDVTNPKNPVWLSTSKTDGRFYSPSYDYWSVELSQDNGKLYAVLSSSYNGAFVYDMASLTAPVRLAHVGIEIPKTSSNYSPLTSSTRTVAYPFDRSQLNWGAVGAVAVEDGLLYLAGATTDLIILESETLFHAPLVQENTTNIDPSANFYTLSDPGLAGFAHFDTQGQVHAVALGKYTYVAAGNDGLLLLDDDLKLVRTIPTQGICYDVQLVNGLLYVAEGRGGLACYDEETLTQQWRYYTGRTVKQVRLSPKQRFAMLHVGGNRAEIVRISDLKCVISKTAGSQMYHHNIINGVVGGRYMAFWANSTDERWYDFGENDDLDVPIEIRAYAKPRCAMTGGIEAVGDLALSMTSSGYILYDPATTADISSGLTIYKPGQSITGKPSEYEGTLITTNRISGAIYIMDASTLTSPSLQKSFTVTGHPATAVYGEESVYIPLGYQGLLRFDFDPYYVGDAKDLTDAEVTLSQSEYTYDGTEKQPAVTVKRGTRTLVQGTDYTVAYSNNIAVGTATVTVTGKGNYSGTAPKTFTISAASIADAEVTLAQTEFTYDSTEKKPAVTVKVGGKTLTEGTDYTVAYSNNTNVGTATVTVTGKGNYSGTATKTFTISANSLAGAFLTLSQTEFVYDGTQHTPSVTVTLRTRTALTEGTDYTVTYTGNRTVGTATVTVTGIGSYSGTVSTTFTIAPKPVTANATAGNKAWDGTTEATVATATVDGIVTGDTVALVNGKAAFVTSDVGENIPVTFSEFSLTGADAGNYILTQPADTTANITVAKAAAEVEALIQALPNTTTLTDAQKEQVKAAKASYDALSESVQKQVSKASAEKLQKLVELANKVPAVTPSTGDNFPTLLVVSMLLLSATAMALLLKRKIF